MTVHELRQRLAGLPDDMLVGAYSQDDELCEVQTAGVFSDPGTGEQVFIIRANGGFPLMGEAA